MEKRVEYTYDEEADVMYISFGKLKPDISHQIESGIYILKHVASGKLCGITIVDFSKRCNSI